MQNAALAAVRRECEAREQNLKLTPAFVRCKMLVANLKYSQCVALQGGVEVRLGDFVELAAAPGERDAQVARVSAMWAECPVDGLPRMLARCCRYYRPPGACSPPLEQARWRFSSGVKRPNLALPQDRVNSPYQGSCLH